MGKDSKIYINLKKAAAIISAALLTFCPFFNTSAQSLPESAFIIKLKPNLNSSILKSSCLNFHKTFDFSDKEIFNNIYTCQSVKPYPQITDDLQGQAIYIEPELKFSKADITLNDPGFTDNQNNIDKQWGLVKTGFLKSWEKSIGSKNTVVAVIDTGIDATHEDLQNVNFVQGFNFIKKEIINGNLNSDDNGHGTLIAGVLAASANNNKGIVGTNWNLSIMPIKALDETGKGDTSSISQAIVWAADHGANIINLSLGGIGFGHDTTLANSITYAFKKNVIIIAAAGNDVAATGKNLDHEPVFPVCDDNNENMIIGVAATDQNDLKTTFSNYGHNCIDVSAPGKRILSTINHDPVTNIYAPNSYAYASGTSMAAPFVSGQAAILKSLFPNATNTEIRDRIFATADSIDNLNLYECGGTSCSQMLGAGRINVYKSIQDKLGTPVADGDLVQTASSADIFQISGGKRRLVSSFVLKQRFPYILVKTINELTLEQYPEGSFATPLDNTLVKSPDSPTVYMIKQGLKLPITYQIFKQRGFSYNQIFTTSKEEINSWSSGGFLPPTEGTIVKSDRSSVLYWVIGGQLHSINKNFYVDRGLYIFPIFIIAGKDFPNYNKGEPYLR